MPARNLHHAAVIDALRAEGWTITHDPLTLPIGDRHVHVDLGVTRATLAAEREGVRIAVEIQSFLSYSPIRDLQEAIGQFVIYRAVLRREDPGRALYLAVPRLADETILAEPVGRLAIAEVQLAFLVYDEQERKVIRWNRQSDTARP